MSKDRNDQQDRGDKTDGPGDEPKDQIQEPSVSLTLGEIDIQKLATSFKGFVTVFIVRRRGVLRKLKEFDENK